MYVCDKQAEIKPVHLAPKPCVDGNEGTGVRLDAVVDQSMPSACERVLTGSPKPILTEVPTVLALL